MNDDKMEAIRAAMLFWEMVYDLGVIDLAGYVAIFDYLQCQYELPNDMLMKSIIGVGKRT